MHSHAPYNAHDHANTSQSTTTHSKNNGEQVYESSQEDSHQVARSDRQKALSLLKALSILDLTKWLVLHGAHGLYGHKPI